MNRCFPTGGSPRGSRLALAFLLAVGFLAASEGPAHADPPASGVKPLVTAQDEIIQNVRLEQKLNGQVPLNLQFMDDSGKTVRLSRYFGEKPVMLIPIQYRCTMLCNEELNALTRSLKELKFNIGDQFNLLAVSIDHRETPAIAAEKKLSYIKEYGRPGGADGWRFLTGDKASIRALTDSMGFYFAYDPKTDQYAHPDGVMILTPQGKIARYFFRLEYPAKDLRYGLIEASQNKIGSPLDYLALLCFHYNPMTGTYSVAIMKVMRLAAVGTVLFLALGILWLRRRDRTSERPVESAA
ncbi:MAG: SCO family protein [Armatimonadetes bacterium]|nr:SCO family protein [Armatimonadota bacterium]